jgi:hypothetical protein
MLRAYLTASVGSTAIIAVLDPDSQHGSALSTSTTPGLIAAGVMFSIIMVSFFDILINDWLPPRVRLAWTHRYRHLGFLAIAACQLGMTLQSVSVQGVEPVLIRYAVDAVAAIGVALWGVWQHSKDVKAEQTQRQRNEDKLVSTLEVERGGG